MIVAITDKILADVGYDYHFKELEGTKLGRLPIKYPEFQLDRTT